MNVCVCVCVCVCVFVTFYLVLHGSTEQCNFLCRVLMELLEKLEIKGVLEAEAQMVLRSLV